MSQEKIYQYLSAAVMYLRNTVVHSVDLLFETILCLIINNALRLSLLVS